MRDANIKKLVLAALMAALTYVATSIVQIPSPMQGYVNLGDCIVLLSGWILGPWWGAAAGGIGSDAGGPAGRLRSLCARHADYQGLHGSGAAVIVKAMKESKASYVISAVVSEVIMVVGYFGYASLLLGKGWGAAASIPGNLVQGAMGMVIGLVLLVVLKRSKALEKLA